MNIRFKKSIIIAITLILVLTLASCGSQTENNGEGQAEITELTFSHAGATGSLVAEVSDLFAKNVESESDNTIKVNVFPSSTLVGHAELFEALQAGNVDIGDFQLSYFTSYMPELSILEVPGIYKGGRYDALRNGIKDAVDAVFEKYGLKYVAAFPQDTMSFIGQEVVDDPLSDLKGKTVRVSGAKNAAAVERWGGSPVSIPINEVPTALERNTVDMVLSTWIAADGFKLYEVAPYITMTEMPETFCGIVMRLEAWNSLSEDQKAAVERAAQTYETKGYEIAMERKQSFLDLMDEEDVTVYFSTEENNALYSKTAWEIANEEVIPEANELAQGLIDAISVDELQ